MADKRPALGKGLSALIPDTLNTPARPQTNEVDIDLLSPNRYQPLVEMAREMSLTTGAPAQAHFDSLLNLLRGPSHLRRSLWYVERNRHLVIALTAIVLSSGLYFAP